MRMMAYYVWDRKTGERLAKCLYKQSAYDFRAIECEKTGRPRTDFRISYE